MLLRSNKKWITRFPLLDLGNENSTEPTIKPDTQGLSRALTETRSKRKLSQSDDQLERHDESSVESKHELDADKVDTKKVKPWKRGENLEPNPLIVKSMYSKGTQLAYRLPLEDLGTGQGMKLKK